MIDGCDAVTFACDILLVNHPVSAAHSKRRPPARAVGPVSWTRRLSTNWKVTAAAGLFLGLTLWALWPSPYSKVANLQSRGSNVIAFGDSLTAGYGASPGEDYPSRLSNLIG